MLGKCRAGRRFRSRREQLQPPPPAANLLPGKRDQAPSENRSQSRIFLSVPARLGSRGCCYSCSWLCSGEVLAWSRWETKNPPLRRAVGFSEKLLLNRSFSFFPHRQ